MTKHYARTFFLSGVVYGGMLTTMCVAMVFGSFWSAFICALAAGLTRTFAGRLAEDIDQ